ncbi:hypothetical protein [Helicobacter pylori]|nr:hypothetical protein [Helicobacter pylori]
MNYPSALEIPKRYDYKQDGSDFSTAASFKQELNDTTTRSN